MGRAILFIAAVFSFTAPAAGEILFPAPLHITRELTDPISGSRAVIDEYCHGNRVVSVNGRRTAIAEYDMALLTTIDFDAGTYSVTRFEDLARVYDKGTATIRGGEWRVETRDGTIVAERKDAHGRQIVRVTADRRLTLSRAALDVLMGTAWPRRPEASSDIVATALRSNEQYHLPLEQVTRFEMDGDSVETRNVIVRVGSELPPQDVFTIPPGARLVEADAVAAIRVLEELDGKR